MCGQMRLHSISLESNLSSNTTVYIRERLSSNKLRPFKIFVPGLKTSCVIFHNKTNYVILVEKMLYLRRDKVPESHVNSLNDSSDEVY